MTVVSRPLCSRSRFVWGRPGPAPAFALLSAAAMLVPWRGEWLQVPADAYISVIVIGTILVLHLGLPRATKGEAAAVVGSALAAYSAFWAITIAMRWGPGVKVGAGNLTAPLLMLLLCAGLCVASPCPRIVVIWWRWYAAACGIYSAVAVGEFLVHVVSPTLYERLPWIAHAFWFYDGTHYHHDIVRVQAGFGFPNDLGRFLIPFLVVEGTRPLHGSHPRTRRRAMVILAALGMLLSFSRAAWACAAAGWAAAMAMHGAARRTDCHRPTRRRGASHRGRVRLIAIVLLLAPVVFWRIASLRFVQDRSITSRLRFLSEGWQAAAANLLHGDPTLLPRDLGSLWLSLMVTWGALPVIVVAATAKLPRVCDL